MSVGAEQRRHARRAVSVEFHGKDAGGEGELTLVGADLSPGGTFLRSDVLLEPGETLTLEFHPPGARRHGDRVPLHAGRRPPAARGGARRGLAASSTA
jgi:hypothetical protein